MTPLELKLLKFDLLTLIAPDGGERPWPAVRMSSLTWLLDCPKMGLECGEARLIKRLYMDIPVGRGFAPEEGSGSLDEMVKSVR